MRTSHPERGILDVIQMWAAVLFASALLFYYILFLHPAIWGYLCDGDWARFVHTLWPY